VTEFSLYFVINYTRLRKSETTAYITFRLH